MDNENLNDNAVAEAEKAAAAEEATVAEEAAKDSAVSVFVNKIKQKTRSFVPVRKTLVIVKEDDGKYECEVKKFAAKKTFKKAALAALFDKVEAGEISVRKRSEVQYDLVVDGKIIYSAVEV